MIAYVFETIFLVLEKRRMDITKKCFCCSFSILYFFIEFTTLIVTAVLLVLTCVLTTPYSDSSGVSRFGILRVFIIDVQLVQFFSDIFYVILIVMPSFYIYIGCYNPFSRRSSCCKVTGLFTIGLRFIEKMHLDKKKPHDDYYFCSCRLCGLVFELACSNDFSNWLVREIRKCFIFSCCMKKQFDDTVTIEMKSMGAISSVSSSNNTKNTKLGHSNIINEQTNPFNVSTVTNLQL